MTVARFYSQYAEDPFFNMAFDEWMFDQTLSGRIPFALRLYRWEPEAITIGLHQRQHRALDWSQADGAIVIRRVTGGRAVYHDRSELTYSVVADLASKSSPILGGGITRSSTVIATALNHYVKAQGISSRQVKMSSPDNGRPAFFHSAPCFASRAKYELVEGQNKVVASAQRRIGSALLQHGSIKLRGVPFHPALGGPESAYFGAAKPLSAKEFARTAACFAKTVGENLGIAFELSTLSSEEMMTVTRKANEIKKNPLACRQLIKQT
jgi:lipoate-protein ligase A